MSDRETKLSRYTIALYVYKDYLETCGNKLFGEWLAQRLSELRGVPGAVCKPVKRGKREADD